MNKTAFTLVELLAIVVILAIIMIIAAPNISNLYKNNEKNTEDILKTKIENASKLYIAKYYASKVAGAGVNEEIARFKLHDLQMDGLLSLKGDTACEDIANSKEIIVKMSAGKLNYDYNSLKPDCYK